MKKLLKMLLVGTLCFGLCACSSDTSSEGESTDGTVVEEEEEEEFVYDVVAPDWWNPTGIGTIIPAPDSEQVSEGKIVFDKDDYFYAEITDCSEEYFETYKEACAGYGFDVDSDVMSSDSYYAAYNDNGDFLELSYWDYNTNLMIVLDQSIANNSINWPGSGLATLLPDPGCSYGEITYDASDYFICTVVGLSETEWSSYVDKCMNDYGFNVDYTRNGRYFYAYNEEGNYLTANYLGFNSVYISIKAAD